MEQTRVVSIPTFVHPHLFWIIEANNSDRIRSLNKLSRVMQNDCTNYKADLNDAFVIGEMVAVMVNNKYYRATVEDICNVNLEDVTKRTCYLCWLVDYGIMYETNAVYKLSDSLMNLTPLAIQASLNNIAYVKQNLTFDDESGLPIKSNKPSIFPTSIVHQIALDLMSNLSNLEFKIEDRVNGIVLGDILYYKHKELKSLRQSLIDKGIVIIENELFKEMQANIPSYREENLWVIAKICKELKSINFLKEVPKESSSKKIITKYLKEFEEIDLFDDTEVTGPLRRRKISQNLDNSFQNSINSESESIFSDTGDNNLNKSNSSSSKSPSGKNRIALLLKKMKEKKRNSEEVGCNKSRLNSDDQPSATASTGFNGENIKKIDVKYNEDDQQIVPQNKRIIPSNVLFMPAGASLNNFSNIVKKFDKPSTSKTSQLKSSSEEEINSLKLMNIKDHSLMDETSTTVSPNDENNTWDDKENAREQENVENVNKLQIKPYCSCKQCDHWTNEKDWQKETKFCDDSIKLKKLAINKPQPLFREDHEINPSRTIISLNYSSKTKIQKQGTPKLLIHGEYSQMPVKLVTDICFHEYIRNSLHQLKYREAKRVQMYTWPAILRNQHVFMINGPQTGKTMAYLPVVLTFILEKNERYEPFLSKTGGPIVVILCASTQKCEEIYDLTKVLLGRVRQKVSLVTYPITNNIKNVDMLITTPRILINILKSRTINFKRLCHLILDDGDKILQRNSETIHKVFHLVQSMLNNRVHPKPVQLIVCAEHWKASIESLAKRLAKTPMICIGNHLEAALYGKIQFSMKFLNSACKEHELNNLLKDTFKIYKSIILCKKEELDTINTILMLKGIDASVITEDMSKEDVLYLEDVWTQCRGGDYTVLVCTDFTLNSLLTITNASLLIHYSLPDSWSQFVRRFACLLENYKSPLDSKKDKTKCQSFVLCDEECEQQMTKFFSFINNTGLRSQLPDKIKSFSEALKHKYEQKKVENRIGLCGTLKLFGSCHISVCPWRHIIHKELDVSDNLPQSGKIKFKIVDLLDVTNFSVQLIEHIDMENKVFQYDDKSDVLKDLTSALNITRTQVIHPLIGHLYVYYDIDELDGEYFRCQLLEFEVGDCVKIKLIDKGNIISTVKNRLYKLPKEFIRKPRKVTDVYLANFVPPYGDENFSAKSYIMLRSLLEKSDYKNLILTADIHLQLEDTLWIKNVYQEVALSQKTIPGFQLTREIVISKLAEYNNNQLNSLYKLCKEAAISLPVYEATVNNPIKDEERIEAQWAHLDTEVNEVTFSAAVSPDEIYVRLNKFNKELSTLHKEIQESLRKPHYPRLQNATIGTICLAKDTEEVDYSRVLIKNIEDGKALCFFVDFGDEAVVDIANLKYIQKKFIKKLPFQSIQCRLHGVKSVFEEWQSDVVNILYEYAMEPNTDFFRLLFAKVCVTEKNSTTPGQHRYSVLLKDSFGEKQILINNLLIECGMAVQNSEEIGDFEISKTLSNHDTNDSTDEELEEIISVCRKTYQIEENLNMANENNELNDDFELVVFDLEGFLNTLRTNDKKPPMRSQQLPAIQAVPAVNYFTPDVYWSQTNEFIKMDIKIPDVDEYVLNLTKKTILNFRTTKNEKTYKLNIMLYQKVASVQHTIMGQHVRVTLTKTSSAEWPRLTISKQKSRNIHYDISTIHVEEKPRKLLEFPNMTDEDEESDGEIDMMYCIASDLDSDMDLDMPDDSD